MSAVKRPIHREMVKVSAAGSGGRGSGGGEAESFALAGNNRKAVSFGTLAVLLSDALGQGEITKKPAVGRPAARLAPEEKGERPGSISLHAGDGRPPAVKERTSGPNLFLRRE